MAAAAPTAAGETTTSAERRQRYGLLLAVLLLSLLVQGMAPASAAERISASVLAGVTLVLALRAAEVRRFYVHAAAGLAVIAVAMSVVAAARGSGEVLSTNVANALLIALAPPAVALGILRRLRRERRIPAEAVLGVICLYLLFGMFFAFVYGVLNRVDEPFFNTGAAAASASQFLYFSFTTLTTVGYGDLTARSQVGHTLAVLEALIGQIYLVTVVSLIVSNVGRERSPR